MSGLSSLGERSVMRDSLLPDSPRVKIGPDKHTINSDIAGAVNKGVKGVCVCFVLFVPVGLTLLREEVRNRKLLGFWA